MPNLKKRKTKYLNNNTKKVTNRYKKSNLTQEEFAKMYHLDQSTLSRLINDKRQ